jgi:hypothetical protein
MSDEAAVMDSEGMVESSDVGSSPEASDSSVDSSPVQSAPESQPEAAVPPQQQQQSVWSAFRSLPDFKGQDDVAIARRLYAAMEREKAATGALAQYQQYVPYTQEYIRNKPQYEAWLASQRQQSQPQQPPQQQRPAAAETMKKWWNPPEIRDSYRQYLVRDENGREVIAENAPLDARHALYEYQKYKADFAQKFLTNPEEALGPMVQGIAQQQAQQIVQAQFQEASEQNYVSQLEQENADWLKDADGNPTEEGLAVQQYIAEAARMGINGPKARWEYVTMRVEHGLQKKLLDLQVQQSQRGAFEAGLQQPNAYAADPAAAAPQQANAPTQAQKDIDFLRREAARNPSRSAGSTDPRVPQAPLTFEQRLARQMGRGT